MPYTESGEISSDSGYNLGEYSFSIERSSVPGSTNDQITAICRQGTKSARKSIQVPSSAHVTWWSVEADETEARVYVTTEKRFEGNLSHPIPVSGPMATHDARQGLTYFDSAPGAVVFVAVTRGTAFSTIYLSKNQFHASAHVVPDDSSRTPYDVDFGYASERTVLDETIYVHSHGDSNINNYDVIYPISYGTPNDYDLYSVLYGEPTAEIKDVLVGTFAIDLMDADPGEWIDPGDYDPNWEPEDPTHTLYVEVTGALSGRHNDPIEDPSYSYIPADKDTVKDYGCGGDGGHGGGGGAGASTVVVHKFATNQANSKEVTAIARRHGYGSGGGKGGKGGNGCILVYY